MRFSLAAPIIVCCANLSFAQGNIDSRGKCSINVTGGVVVNPKIICPPSVEKRQYDTVPQFHFPVIPQVCLFGERVVAFRKSSFKTPDGKKLIVNPGDQFTAKLWNGSECIVEYCTENAGGLCLQGTISKNDIVLDGKIEAAVNTCRSRHIADSEMRNCLLSEIRR